MAFFQAALRGSLRRAAAGARAASKSPSAVELLGSRGAATSVAAATEQAASSQAALLRFGTTLGLGFAAVGAAMSSSPVAHCAAVEAPEAPPATGTETSQGTKTTVVFVLGGPGSGKGTQCGKIVEEFPDVAHFSAGDLLRAHVKSGTEEGNKVAEMMQQGQIVPSSVTVGLLQDAMKSSGKTKFLIDGFPRNVENRQAFEDCTGRDCDFVLFFDCPEDVMEKRLLGRNEGRADDNIETIRKRFKVFVDSSMPVIDYYGKLDKLYKIQATRDPNDVYTDVRRLFM